MSICRALPSVLTLALLAPGAGAAPAPPSSLSGEWYGGNVYPRSAYAPEGFRQASSDTERLLLRPNGTYELATLSKTATPETFGWSGRMISCEKISLRLESGKFSVQGSTLTLRAGAVRIVNLATPDRLNSGCQRFPGLSSNGTPPAPRAFTWKVAGTTLTLTAAGEKFVVRRAGAEELRQANTPSPPPPPPAPVVDTPRPVAPPPPVRTDASGKWVGRFTTDGGAPLDVRLNLEDDRLGIQGMVLSAEEKYLGTARGDYKAGTLTLTLNLPDDSTVELRATGTFAGDTFTGCFQGMASNGQALGGGQVRLTREPLPVRQR